MINFAGVDLGGNLAKGLQVSVTTFFQRYLVLPGVYAGQKLTFLDLVSITNQNGGQLAAHFGFHFDGLRSPNGTVGVNRQHQISLPDLADVDLDGFFLGRFFRVAILALGRVATRIGYLGSGKACIGVVLASVETAR